MQDSNALPVSQAAVDVRPEEVIRRFLAGRPAHGDPKVIKSRYRGEEAFLLLAMCCDQFNYLYTKAGVRICAPSGGLTGAGDGNCK